MPPTHHVTNNPSHYMAPAACITPHYIALHFIIVAYAQLLLPALLCCVNTCNTLLLSSAQCDIISLLIHMSLTALDSWTLHFFAVTCPASQCSDMPCQCMQCTVYNPHARGALGSLICERCGFLGCRWQRLVLLLQRTGSPLTTLTP